MQSSPFHFRFAEVKLEVEKETHLACLDDSEFSMRPSTATPAVPSSKMSHSSSSFSVCNRVLSLQLETLPLQLHRTSALHPLDASPSSFKNGAPKILYKAVLIFALAYLYIDMHTLVSVNLIARVSWDHDLK